MRSPADADIAQVEVTPACHLACSNCTHFSPMFGAVKKWFLSEEHLRNAVNAMRGWYQPGRILGWIGGEPTLHPRFEELALLFAELWGDPKSFDNGKYPIVDFAAYAEERLWDRRGGRGLWSSPGPTYMKNFGVIQKVFGHQTLNDHFSEGIHKSLMITRQELGIGDREWIEMRDACWVQNTWSPGIRKDKFYMCEVMGAIDDLVFDGAHGVPVEPGCWNRKPDEFIGPAGDQRNICELCCACVKNTPSQVANVERHQISPVWQKILENVGSPQVKKGTLDLYQLGGIQTQATDAPLPIIDERPHTKDRYMPGPEMRVSPDNPWVRPQNLALVVVCVGYGQLLAKTLAMFMQDGFDQIVVVTTPGDDETVRTISHTSVPSAEWPNDPSRTLKFVTSSRCYDNDFAFNKGAMLNDGLAALTKPDWILFTDADILLAPDTGEFIRSRTWNPDCLYYTERHDSDSPHDINREANGYFQLWNRRCRQLRDRWPHPVSEAFCSAGGVDSHFMSQWRDDEKVFVPELAVRHIQHGEFAKNWNGVAVKRGTWRQIGWAIMKDDVPRVTWLDAAHHSPEPKDLLLTETRYGSSLTIEPFDAAFREACEKLDIHAKGCHIHIACME